MDNTTFRTVLPKFKAIDNGDGTYSAAVAFLTAPAVPTGRAVTFMVGVADAQALSISQSDYDGDGTADDVQIKLAFDGLPT